MLQDAVSKEIQFPQSALYFSSLVIPPSLFYHCPQYFFQAYKAFLAIFYSLDFGYPRRVPLQETLRQADNSSK